MHTQTSCIDDSDDVDDDDDDDVRTTTLMMIMTMLVVTTICYLFCFCCYFTGLRHSYIRKCFFVPTPPPPPTILLLPLWIWLLLLLSGFTFVWLTSICFCVSMPPWLFRRRLLPLAPAACPPLYTKQKTAVTLQFVSHNFLDYHDPTIGK